jgi:hypothetical protein
MSLAIIFAWSFPFHDGTRKLGLTYSISSIRPSIPRLVDLAPSMTSCSVTPLVVMARVNASSRTAHQAASTYARFSGALRSFGTVWPVPLIPKYTRLLPVKAPHYDQKSFPLTGPIWRRWHVQCRLYDLCPSHISRRLVRGGRRSGS